MGVTLQDILRDPEVSFSELIQWLEGKVSREGLNALSAQAQALYYADRYDRGVFRGGHYTLMFYDPDLDIMQMIPSLEAIGAPKTAQVLRDLAALFPGGIIPIGREPRLSQYESVCEKLRTERIDARGPEAAEDPSRLEEQLRAANENVYLLAVRFALDHKELLLQEDAEPNAAADRGRM